MSSFPEVHAHLCHDQVGLVLTQADHDRETDAGEAAWVNDQLKRRRYQLIPVQGKWLRSVLQGHAVYFAVPGNTDAVSAFRYQLTRHWFKAL